ncbi:MAG: hypothetical protein E7158_02250 [Firmicutes bacterium]|nr:hypothetical protein [Bacillota bacterium]
MDKKNQVLLTVIAVATLLVAVVGATFAYFSARVVENNKTETKLRTAELGITFEGTQEITTDCSNGTATDDTNTTIPQSGDPAHRSYNCVSGSSWEPGSIGHKLFTVENTSDYDMTFDINWTKVVNNFSRTQDLTYSIAASYVAPTAGGDAHAGNVQMIDMTAANANSVANSTKATFAASGTLPTDATASVAQDGTVTYGTGSAQRVVRVFIPAHSKESFDITVTYVDAVESGVPVDQNEDQGKTFRTTVTVTSNGIDAGSLRS